MQETAGTLFSREKAFWDTYRAGRPSVPDSFFARIFAYHAAKSNPPSPANQSHPTFNVAHDAGAGDGLHAPRLRARFAHVIVSDLAPGNVALARERLAGTEDGAYTFRAAGVDDTTGLPPGGIDLVLCCNMLHFAPSQEAAVAAFARQLRPGGTLAVAGFAPAVFPKGSPLEELWERFRMRLGDSMIEGAEGMAGSDGGERLEELLQWLERTTGWYNVAPLDGGLFKDGAMRVRINARGGGFLGMGRIPERLVGRVVVESCVGEKDIVVWEEDEGWYGEMDGEEVKAHFESFNLASAARDELAEMYQEVDRLLPDGERVRVTFPCQLTLATRRFDAK